MTDHGLEPAAYRARFDHKTDSVHTSNPCWIAQSRVEPCFAASDIIQLIEKQIERHEEEHEEVVECSIDDCPYGMSTDQHADEEFLIAGRKQSLRELKTRISGSGDDAE